MGGEVEESKVRCHGRCSAAKVGSAWMGAVRLIKCLIDKQTRNDGEVHERNAVYFTCEFDVRRHVSSQVVKDMGTILSFRFSLSQQSGSRENHSQSIQP